MTKQEIEEQKLLGTIYNVLKASAKREVEEATINLAKAQQKLADLKKCIVGEEVDVLAEDFHTAEDNALGVVR
jgi:hypothetical protein